MSSPRVRTCSSKLKRHKCWHAWAEGMEGGRAAGGEETPPPPRRPCVAT